MNKITLAVKCTREEYMNFYANIRKRSLWTTVIGTIVLLVTVVLCVIDQMMKQHTLLLAMIGIVLVLLTPVILPTVRRGAAGRRYDNSDALKGAVSLTMDAKTLTIRTACQEGCVPLAALTDVWQTKELTALVFGKELTVCIPMRSMTADEAAAFETFLAPYKKEQA